jgi:hypothetical protein
LSSTVPVGLLACGGATNNQGLHDVRLKSNAGNSQTNSSGAASGNGHVHHLFIT